jgi:hypothetical protein
LGKDSADGRGNAGVPPARASGGNPFISNTTLAKIIGSQNNIGMARLLMISRGWPIGIDGRRSGNGTAYRYGALVAAHVAVHSIQYPEFPHPEYRRSNG